MGFKLTYKAPRKKKTFDFLRKVKTIDYQAILSKYGEKGVAALANATPQNTGRTSNAWRYEIKVTSDYYSLSWINSNLTDQGTPIVIMLQYGHGTGTGGYVRGLDFINPAIQPIFDEIADEAWKEVTSA